MIKVNINNQLQDNGFVSLLLRALDDFTDVQLAQASIGMASVRKAVIISTV
jgi:hypothetical protein